KYIILNLFIIKILVFIDNLFVNNKNFNFQIKYKIILINKRQLNDKKFKIKRNFIYYNFIKNKRVTKNVLTSEIYNIIKKFDIVIIIEFIIDIII
ncbi:hypothetical protein BDZ45DRAFT_608933, partial [Acephala macrosclerotiorum]